MAAESRLTHRIFGYPGSERLVVLIGTGVGVAADPLPAETAARKVTVLAVALGEATMLDPGGYGGETPAEQTADWLVALTRQTLAAMEPTAAQSAGVVVYGPAMDVAVRAAALLGEEVDRLALVAVATPEQPLDRDDLGELIGRITAQALIINDDSAAESASWYAERLASAQVELVAEAPPLPLSAVWGRALSHVAPDAGR